MTTEIDLTEGTDVDPYDEIAKRVFNEMLELIVALKTEGGLMPHERGALRDKYDKEVRSWKRANEDLKATAKMLSEDNEAFERENEKLRKENQELRRQLNEAIINAQLPRNERHTYPLMERLSDASRREIEKLMQAPGSGKGE